MAVNVNANVNQLFEHLPHEVTLSLWLQALPKLRLLDFLNHAEQHFCFLLGSTEVVPSNGEEEKSPLRQTKVQPESSLVFLFHFLLLLVPGLAKVPGVNQGVAARAVFI